MSEPTTSEPATLDEWFAAYVACFFEGEALARTLAYLMNHCSFDVTDPVCSTLGLFLTSPVTFAVTTVGLLPFRGVSTAVLAYTGMSAAQHAFLRRLVAFLQRERLGAVSSQMGGSPVLSLGRAHARSLEHVDVLGVFLRGVLANEAYPAAATRRAICDIVLQRLAATAGVSRESMCRLHATVLKAPAPVDGRDGGARGDDARGERAARGARA
jgi:hypothetical protein